MANMLVRTEQSGWYLNAADPDGSKVRKVDDDKVFLSLIEAKNALAKIPEPPEPEETSADQTQATVNEPENLDNPAPDLIAPEPPKRAKEARPPTPTTTTSTGKVFVGQKVTIKCKWRGDNGGEPRCNEKRVIKAQDKFQVKYCVKHQSRSRTLKRMAKKRAVTAAKRRQAQLEYDRAGKKK